MVDSSRGERLKKFMSSVWRPQSFLHNSGSWRCILPEGVAYCNQSPYIHHHSDGGCKNELINYFYIDTNIWNKGLIRIKMLQVKMSIGRLWSDLPHSERNYFLIERDCIYISLFQTTPCTHLFRWWLPVWVKLLSLHMCAVHILRLSYVLYWPCSLITENSRNKSRGF